jgi:hypothetical protein
MLLVSPFRHLLKRSKIIQYAVKNVIQDMSLFPRSSTLFSKVAGVEKERSGRDRGLEFLEARVACLLFEERPKSTC